LIIILGFIIITSYFIAIPFRVIISVVAIAFGLFVVAIIHVIKIIMIVWLNNFFLVVLFEVFLLPKELAEESKLSTLCTS
jgi:hypothetical protein